MATDPHADVPLTDDVSFAKGEFVPAESVVSDRVATGLTYAEARDNGVLLVEDEAGEHLAMRQSADPLVLLDLRRRFGRPLRVEKVEPQRFEALLAELGLQWAPHKRRGSWQLYSPARWIHGWIVCV